METRSQVDLSLQIISGYAGFFQLLQIISGIWSDILDHKPKDYVDFNPYCVYAMLLQESKLLTDTQPGGKLNRDSLHKSSMLLVNVQYADFWVDGKAESIMFV